MPAFVQSVLEDIVLLDGISIALLLSPSRLLQSSNEPGSKNICRRIELYETTMDR
jgi:hypothetical protein